MDDPRVLAAIEELGYRHVGWDVDPFDWEDGRTVDELVERVVPGEGIVLLHAWPAVTAEGLGRVIAGLRERGAEFVAVDELSSRLLSRSAGVQVERPRFSRYCWW